jgi:hypothetical protein
MRRRLARRVTRDGLRHHRSILHVAKLVHHRDHLPRMHVDGALRGLERPRPACVRVELDRDRARDIDLRVARSEL